MNDLYQWIPTALALAGLVGGYFAFKGDVGAEFASMAATEKEREIRSTRLVGEVFARLEALEIRAEGLPALRASFCAHLNNAHEIGACSVPAVP